MDARRAILADSVTVPAPNRAVEHLPVMIVLSAREDTGARCAIKSVPAACSRPATTRARAFNQTARAGATEISEVRCATFRVRRAQRTDLRALDTAFAIPMPRASAFGIRLGVTGTKRLATFALMNIEEHHAPSDARLLADDCAMEQEHATRMVSVIAFIRAVDESVILCGMARAATRARSTGSTAPRAARPASACTATARRASTATARASASSGGRASSATSRARSAPARRRARATAAASRRRRRATASLASQT